jgi:RimJ/RimL family protein N-acetyltransferase
MQIIETPRLSIRHLDERDFNALYALCSDPDVVRYMGDGQPLTAEQTRQWIGVSINNYATRGYGCSAVIDKASGAMIGFCGLVHPVEAPEDVEIIYALRPEYWGRGLASEAAGAMLRYGLERFQLPQILATIDAANTASIAIVEKLGMRYLKTEPRDDGSSTLFYVIEPPA